MKLSQSQPQTFDFFEERAKVSDAANKTYKKLRRATKKDARFELAFQKALNLAKIPTDAEVAFRELYLDIYSRVCMIRTYKRKEFNGKVLGTPTNTFAGTNLPRLIKFCVEEMPVEPDPDIADIIRQIKRQSIINVSEDTLEGYFEFLEPTNEKLILRDYQSYNISGIAKLACAIPKYAHGKFLESLAEEPWLRCSSSTGQFLFRMAKKRICKWVEKKSGIIINNLHLPVKEKINFIKFKLDSDDRWHTATTRAEAELVAKTLNKQVMDIKEVSNKTFKKVEVVDGNGCPIPASYRGWEDVEPYLLLN
jgi:hypothetical protein